MLAKVLVHVGWGNALRGLGPMMVEMELVEIAVSESGQHIIFLLEKDGQRSFPIFIGPAETMAMQDAVRGHTHSRPLTHDLILNCIRDLGGELTGVIVDDLRNETFHGKLLVRNGYGETIQVDSRPSDAIVLAMKTKSPIYVNEEVLATTTREDDEH